MRQIRANPVPMSQTELKIGHLDENTGASTRNTNTLVFSFEKTGGFLFGIIDVAGSKKVAEQMYEILDQEFEKLVGEVDGSTNWQHAFEQLLSTINDRVEQKAASEKWKLDPNKFNGLIAMASGETMFLTGAGDLVGIFLHQKDKKRYQIFNLFRGVQTEKGKASWDKIYSVVLDGQLTDGDIFLVACQELQSEVAKEELMSVLTTLPPSGAAVKLRQYFPLKTNFASIILKAQNSTRADAIAESNIDTHSSIKQMNQVSDDTQRLLEDQRPKITKGSFIVRLLTDLGKVLLAIVTVTAGLAWGLLRAIGRLSYILIRTDRKETLKLTKSRTDKAVDTVLGRFKRLPKSSKYVLLAILALILVFVISVMFITRNKAVERADDLFVTSVQVVEEKRDEALASAIYQDEDRARTQLFEALDMINAIQTTDETQKAQLDALVVEINVALDDLRHVTNIEVPDVLADLRAIESEALATNIAQASNGLFLFADNGSVYQLDSENKTLVLNEEAASDSVGSALASGWDDTNNLIFFLDDNPGLSMFDPDQNILTDMSADLIGSVPDIEVYARRIYAVAPETEQILRYDRVGYDFGSGTPWIESHSTDLTDAISITIDGDVYLLKSDGEFVKFTSGNETSWSVDTIDPALSGSNARIWSTDTSDFMYVLDPDQNRVLIIRKESGAFIVQYTSENFTDLKDMIVDEGVGLIYLLAGTQILSIDAVHLN